MALIALYGGSFDPITFAHLTVVFEILMSGLCDQVWLVPSGDGRKDKLASTKSADRLKMCQLAIEDVSRHERGENERNDFIHEQVCEDEARNNKWCSFYDSVKVQKII